MQLLKENKGSVELGKDTSDSEIKKFTEKGINVQLVDSNTEKLLEEKPTQPIQKQNETLKQEITSRIAIDDCNNKQKDMITLQKKNYIYNQEEINRKLSIDKLFNTQV
jgi:Na+-transporting NADH:ubiquinone oxidoreductase subunit NqrC